MGIHPPTQQETSQEIKNTTVNTVQIYFFSPQNLLNLLLNCPGVFDEMQIISDVEYLGGKVCDSRVWGVDVLPSDVPPDD
jgi:hypothetical protein